DDIRRRVRPPDPLLLLPTSPAANGSSTLWMYPAPQVFRYTGRQSFGAVYTLCFKGGRQMAGLSGIAMYNIHRDETDTTLSGRRYCENPFDNEPAKRPNGIGTCSRMHPRKIRRKRKDR